MRGLAQWLREAIVGNVAYKIAALFFALVTWGWVQSEQIVELDLPARVEWRFPDGLVPVEPPPESANVRLKGVQGYVRGVRSQDLTIVVDLAGAREGQVSVNLGERPVEGLPAQVRAEATVPAQASLVLDRLLERRVPIIATTRGELPPGLRLTKLSVTPEHVALRGPASTLRALAEVSTDAIDLSTVAEDAVLEVGLALPRGQVQPTAEGRFTVRVDITEQLTTRALEGVPLELPAGWTSTMDTVALELTAPARGLSTLDPASLRVRVLVPEDVAAEARSLRAAWGTEVGPRLELDLPPGLKNAQVTGAPLEISRP